jgi:hypothetical protein
VPQHHSDKNLALALTSSRKLSVPWAGTWAPSVTVGGHHGLRVSSALCVLVVRPDAVTFQLALLQCWEISSPLHSLSGPEQATAPPLYSSLLGSGCRMGSSRKWNEHVLCLLSLILGVPCTELTWERLWTRYWEVGEPHRQRCLPGGASVPPGGDSGQNP